MQLSFKRLVFLLTMLAIFTMAARVSTDSDTWWHLRAGKTIVDEREIIDRDLFSLTRQGEPWEYPGWLAEIALYGAFSLFGFAGLNLLTALAVTLAFVLIWFLLEGRLLLRSAVLLLAAATSALYWSARPQIFSFALAAAYLLILELDRRSSTRLLWVLGPLMALWGNLHGGFAIGFILIGLYLVSLLSSALLEWNQTGSTPKDIWVRYKRRILRLTGVGLLAAVFLGLNPHGFTMLVYPFKTVSIGVLRGYIQEWQSPDFHQAQVQPFLAMMLLSAAALAATERPIRPAEILVLLVFNAMALFAARNVALYALVAAPVLVRHLDSAISRVSWPATRGGEIPERYSRRINVLLFLILLIPAVLKVMLPLSSDTNEDAIEGAFPSAAVTFLRASDMPGPIFNSYNWGAYIIWELYPRYLSFVDGRTDLFNDEILEQYLQVWRGEVGWESLLDRWGIATVLVEPDSPIRFRLQASADWMNVYEDAQAVIFARISQR